VYEDGEVEFASLVAQEMVLLLNEKPAGKTFEARVQIQKTKEEEEEEEEEEAEEEEEEEEGEENEEEEDKTEKQPKKKKKKQNKKKETKKKKKKKAPKSAYQLFVKEYVSFDPPLSECALSLLVVKRDNLLVYMIHHFFSPKSCLCLIL